MAGGGWERVGAWELCLAQPVSQQGLSQDWVVMLTPRPLWVILSLLKLALSGDPASDLILVGVTLLCCLIGQDDTCQDRNHRGLCHTGASWWMRTQNVMHVKAWGHERNQCMTNSIEQGSVHQRRLLPGY